MEVKYSEHQVIGNGEHSFFPLPFKKGKTILNLYGYIPAKAED